MVYLVTELVVAPHSRRYSDMPEIWDAYRPILRDLVGSNHRPSSTSLKANRKTAGVLD